MDVGERDGGVFRDDFVGAHAHPLVPDRDVLDLDAMAVNPGPPAADTRSAHNADTVGRVFGGRAFGRVRRNIRRWGSGWFHQHTVTRERTNRQHKAKGVKTGRILFPGPERVGTGRAGLRRPCA